MAARATVWDTSSQVPPLPGSSSVADARRHRPGRPVHHRGPPEVDDTVPSATEPPDDTSGDVAIDSATLSGGGKVYVPSCGYSVQAQNADDAPVMVRGTGFNETMQQTADGSFSLAIPSGVWSSGDVGTREVVVVAGGGASDERSAGAIEIIAICPKD